MTMSRDATPADFPAVLALLVGLGAALLAVVIVLDALGRP